jgi:peptidoglycan/LPS O-acetylase OafA/YrhL
MNSSVKPAKRNINIEILRIFAMLFILACHMIIHFDPAAKHFNMELIAQPGWKSAIKFLIVQYGQVGVSIFFMISGFFLVKKSFKWERVFSTWLQVFLYSASIFILAIFITRFTGIPTIFSDILGTQGEIIHTGVWSFAPFLNGSYWFITAYILVLLFSPFINRIFESFRKQDIQKLIALLSFASIWMLFFPSSGFWNNAVYGILCYLIGGYVRHFHKTKVIHKKSLFVASCIIFIATVLMTAFNYMATTQSPITHFFSWNSQVKQGIQILPIVIATSLFTTTVNSNPLQLHTRGSKITLTAAKSTFGVYLIHENIFGFRILWEMASRIVPFQSSYFSFTVIFLIVLLLIFCILTFIAFGIDTVLVGPIRSYLTRKIVKLSKSK